MGHQCNAISVGIIWSNFLPLEHIQQHSVQDTYLQKINLNSKLLNFSLKLQRLGKINAVMWFWVNRSYTLPLNQLKVHLNDWWLMIDDWWLMIDDWWLMIDDWWLMIDDWWLMIDAWCLMKTIFWELPTCIYGQHVSIFSFLFFLLWNDVQLQPKLLDHLVFCHAALNDFLPQTSVSAFLVFLFFVLWNDVKLQPKLLDHLVFCHAALNDFLPQTSVSAFLVFLFFVLWNDVKLQPKLVDRLVFCGLYQPPYFVYGKLGLVLITM